jgi:hypothetical protein
MPSLALADLSSRTAPVAEKKKKKWIQKAVKHPGREKERAKEHGVSTHEQMVTDSHSSDKSTRAAGGLGLRLSGMSKRKKHKSKLYDHHAED